MFELFDYQNAHKKEHNFGVAHYFFMNEYLYDPTRLGRSTLRSLDYLDIQHMYLREFYRNQILILYCDQEANIMIGEQEYFVQQKKLCAFFVPYNPNSSHNKVLKIDQKLNIWIFVLDTDLDYQDVQPLDVEHTTYSKTRVVVQEVKQDITINHENFPFYCHVIEGEILVDHQIISDKSGFYSNQKVTILSEKNAKIITFEMPIPL